MNSRCSRLACVSVIWLAGLLTGCSGGSNGSNGSNGNGSPNEVPTISSLSQNSGPPASSITITGSGFNPSSPVWVSFTNSAGVVIDIPPLQTTQTSITVPVPLFVDQSSGSPVTGMASLQVVQSSGSTSSTSNSVQFAITSGAVPSPLQAGTVTLGFLQGELLALQNFRQSIVGTARDSALFESGYAAQIDSINQIVSGLQSVINGTPSFTLGTIHGQTISVKKGDLQNSDATLVGLLGLVANLSANSNAVAGVAPHATHKMVLLSETSSGGSQIQLDAASLYDISTSDGTTQGQVSSSVAELIGASGDTTDPEFTQNLMLWTGACFGAGLLVEPLALPALIYSVTGLDLVAGFLEAAPDLASSLYSGPIDLTNFLTLPLAGALAGGEGVVLYGLIAGTNELIDDYLVPDLCDEGNCSAAGSYYVVPVSVGGSSDNVTNVQVCAVFGGSNNSVCGPNGGFQVGGSGDILIDPIIVNSDGQFGVDPFAVEGASYSITVSGNQYAASFCSVTSGGSGTFGSPIATAVVTCE